MWLAQIFHVAKYLFILLIILLEHTSRSGIAKSKIYMDFRLLVHVSALFFRKIVLICMLIWLQLITLVFLNLTAICLVATKHTDCVVLQIGKKRGQKQLTKFYHVLIISVILIWHNPFPCLFLASLCIWIHDMFYYSARSLK